jgi:hypothetical protein
MQLARRGWSENARAFIAWQTACANAAGLLSTFVEWESSSLPINGGGSSSRGSGGGGDDGGGSGGGGSTIARSTVMHLASTDRVNLVNFSTCLLRLAGVVVFPMHPGNQDDNDGNGGGPE